MKRMTKRPKRRFDSKKGKYVKEARKIKPEQKEIVIGRGKHKADKYFLSFIGKKRRYNRRHKIV